MRSTRSLFGIVFLSAYALVASQILDLANLVMSDGLDCVSTTYGSDPSCCCVPSDDGCCCTNSASQERLGSAVILLRIECPGPEGTALSLKRHVPLQTCPSSIHGVGNIRAGWTPSGDVATGNSIAPFPVEKVPIRA